MGKVSDCMYVSDCRAKGRKFDPGPVPYFRDQISMAILLFSTDTRRVVSYKQRYVHKALVNRLVKLAQEKVRPGELTVQTRP